jgi:hypothetical protein
MRERLPAPTGDPAVCADGGLAALSRGRWARDAAFLVALGLFGRLVALAVLGPQPAADSARYVRAASEWARDGFRPGELVWDHGGYFPGYVAFLGVTGGAHDGLTPLLAQTLAGALVPAGLYLTLRRAGSSRLLAWLAALAVLASYEVARWDGYLLTESLFVTTSAVAMATVILALRPGHGRWAAAAGAAVLLALAIRPTGLGVAAGALGAAVTWRPFPRRLVLGILAALMAYGAYLGVVMAPATRAARSSDICWNLVAGRVFWGTDAYRVTPIGDWAAWSGLGLARCVGRAVATAPAEVAELVGRRAVAYWTPVYGHYSPRHNAANLVLLGVPLALMVVGAARSPRRVREDPLTLVPLAWVAAFTAQHALTWVEADHRFLAPVLPAVYVLAAAGVERLCDAWPRSLSARGADRPAPPRAAAGALLESGRGERRL